MPQLIFFIAVGVAAYVGYRMFLREAERVTAKIRRHEKEVRTGTSAARGPWTWNRSSPEDSTERRSANRANTERLSSR